GASQSATSPRAAGLRLRIEPHQALHRVLTRLAAHLGARLQRDADARPLRRAEQAAAFVLVELHAAYAGGFAVRHARDWAGNRRRRATRAASFAAVLRLSVLDRPAQR